MYGLINQGLHDLAVQSGGEELWREIKSNAGCDLEAFVGLDTYPDDLTYRLVEATATAVRMTPAEVLHAFGKHWIMYTVCRGYGAILDTMGRTLPVFLANLDTMHARLSLSMPEMRPPSFVCEQLSNSEIRLEYWSERPGLAPMVTGLLEGLGEMYDVAVVVDHTVRASLGADHDEFLIRYVAIAGEPPVEHDGPLAVVTSDG